MNVVFLLPHMKTGGAESLVKDYAIGLQKRGINVSIILVSPSLDTPFEKILKDNDVNIYFLGDKIYIHRNDNIITKIIKKIKRYILFKSLIEEIKPSVVHSHLIVNDYMVFLKKNNNTKLFHTIHSEVDTLFNKDRKIHKFATQYLVKNRNMTLITLHERMKMDAKKLFATDNCLVLNNGIELSKFQNPSYSREDLLETLHISKDSFVVGHVGRFVDQKNHNYLIDIFYEIQKINSKAVLLLIGDGLLQEDIKNKVSNLSIENNVVFLGNRQDVPDLLNCMDVFVFPSKIEGFGLSVIEAQMAGLKCIVSTRVPKEVHVSNHVCFLDLKEKPQTWANAALGNIVMFEDAKFNIEDYDIDNIIDKLVTIYK